MSDTAVRVIQWNILSPALADPESFPHCNPAALDPEARWVNISNRIKKEINDSSKTKPTFCLQEICQNWLSRLITLFEAHNYVLVHRSYGTEKNDYMGIGIAYPRDLYHMTGCNIVRVADKIPTPPKNTVVAVAQPGLLTNLYHSSVNFGYDLFAKLTGKTVPTPVDQWEVARHKWNMMVMISLVHADLYKQNGGWDPKDEFIVATYHMPCDFMKWTVMTLHSYYSSMIVQEWATQNGITSFVFAGDFNIKPDSPQYKFLTQGEVPKLQTLEQGGLTCMPWYNDSFQPMVSAYVALYQQEPRFTNYAHSSRSENPFEATIDYIFTDTDTWSYDDGLQLPPSNGAAHFETTLPTLEEPSDHLMIEVTLHRANFRSVSD